MIVEDYALEILKVNETTLSKDDVLLVKIDDFYNKQNSIKMRIGEVFQQTFKDNKVLVLPSDVTIEIIREKLGE